MAAQEIFERVDDENDGRNFQDPEGHHRERVGDEELHQRRHNHRDARKNISHRLIRQRDVVSEVNEDERDGQQRDECVNQAAAHKNAEAISEITHRFREK